MQGTTGNAGTDVSIYQSSVMRIQTPGVIRSDRYRALVRDMQKLFFIFSFLFKKAFACPLPLDRGF